MPSPTPLRLRFGGDPGRLAGFDVDNALRKGRRRPRQLRDDVELLRIEQRSADSIEVALLVPPPVASVIS